jgi:hypothetical protein
MFIFNDVLLSSRDWLIEIVYERLHSRCFGMV